jgi:hypothetical protein
MENSLALGEENSLITFLLPKHSKKNSLLRTINKPKQKSLTIRVFGLEIGNPTFRDGE